MSITAIRLRALREDRGMSQEDVAKHIGISRTAYNKYERGVAKPIRKLNELSSLFRVSSDFILGKDAICNTKQEEDFYIKYTSLPDEGKRLINKIIDAVYEFENSGYRRN